MKKSKIQQTHQKSYNMNVYIQKFIFSEIYKSSWIKIVNNKKYPNTIAGVGNLQTSLQIQSYVSYSNKKTLKIIKKEKNINIIISDDFNLDLLKYDSDMCFQIP